MRVRTTNIVNEALEVAAAFNEGAKGNLDALEKAYAYGNVTVGW